MSELDEITGGLDLLGDWLDAKGYGEEAGLCTRSMDLIHKQDTEITRLRAENERLREALRRIDGMATIICMKDDAGYGIRAESVMPIYQTARAALEGVTEPASPWRDIASAPKDGTWIFIYKDSWHGAIKAKWDTIDGVDELFTGWVFQDEFLSIGCAEGCLGYNEDIEDGYMPTHWMPLPEPPSND